MACSSSSPCTFKQPCDRIESMLMRCFASSRSGCFAIISPFPLAVFARTSIMNYLDERRTRRHFDEHAMRPRLGRGESSRSDPLAIHWHRFKETTFDDAASRSRNLDVPFKAHIKLDRADVDKADEGDGGMVAGWIDARASSHPYSRPIDPSSAV